MTRRILTDFVIDKIAAVDRPCQEHAIVTITKRAPDQRSAVAVLLDELSKRVKVASGEAASRGLAKLKINVLAAQVAKAKDRLGHGSEKRGGKGRVVGPSPKEMLANAKTMYGADDPRVLALAARQRGGSPTKSKSKGWKVHHEASGHKAFFRARPDAVEHRQHILSNHSQGFRGVSITDPKGRLIYG